jgi:hypothetical protein
VFERRWRAKQVAGYKIDVDSTNFGRAIGNRPVEFTYQSMIAEGLASH